MKEPGDFMQVYLDLLPSRIRPFSSLPVKTVIPISGSSILPPLKLWSGKSQVGVFDFFIWLFIVSLFPSQPPTDIINAYVKI